MQVHIVSVRERNGIVVMVAHRPSAIDVVDYVLVMKTGQMTAFGPRNDILSKVVKRQTGHSQRKQGTPASATSVSVSSLHSPSSINANSLESVDTRTYVSNRSEVDSNVHF